MIYIDDDSSIRALDPSSKLSSTNSSLTSLQSPKSSANDDDVDDDTLADENNFSLNHTNPSDERSDNSDDSDENPNPRSIAPPVPLNNYTAPCEGSGKMSPSENTSR